MSAQQKTVLVVGATGNLGTLITRALIAQPDVDVRLLVRPQSRDKVAAVFGAAVTLVEADLTSDHDILRAACEGVFTVVSVVQGGPEVIIDGQLALLRAAADAGVTRFIPSDYSFNIFGLDPGENINTDWRRTFAERSSEVRGPVQIVHIMIGCFLDLGVLFGFLGAFDLQAGTMPLWGDGRVPMDFTTYADTAQYTALAATREQVPERVQVVGDRRDFWQLKELVEAETGRSFDVIRHGELADLDAEISQRQAAAPDNVFAWLPLMYWRGMLSGKGQLAHTVNDAFPEVSPTSIAEYARQHRAQLAGS
ncbi:MAG: NmrA family NAD(P)-binding protein [Haliangiales bacterium]